MSRKFIIGVLFLLAAMAVAILIISLSNGCSTASRVVLQPAIKIGGEATVDESDDHGLEPDVFAVASVDVSTVDSSGRSELVCAIKQWSGSAPWWECGVKVTVGSTEHEQLAALYADQLYDASSWYRHYPYLLSGLVQQESGFDRCQIGRPSRKAAGLVQHPTQEQVLSRFKNMRHGRRVDAGLAQFLWPWGSPYGVTEGVGLEQVLGLKWSVDALGYTLDRGRRTARGTKRDGLRVLQPSEWYFVRHRTPYGWSGRYYHAVTSKAERLRSLSKRCG